MRPLGSVDVHPQHARDAPGRRIDHGRERRDEGPVLIGVRPDGDPATCEDALEPGRRLRVERPGLRVPRVAGGDAVDREHHAIALERHEIEPADVPARVLHQAELLAEPHVVGGGLVRRRGGLRCDPVRVDRRGGERGAAEKRLASVHVPALGHERGHVEPPREDDDQ